MTNKPSLIAFLSITALSAGCSSITGSSEQTVSVEARSAQGQVPGAACELDNDKGKWFITSPGSTQITRSNENLMVICKKDGLSPGSVTVESSTKGSMAGNILFGGIIGAIVDHNTGAAYEYPNLIQVLMGQTRNIPATPKPDAAKRKGPDSGA